MTEAREDRPPAVGGVDHVPDANEARATVAPDAHDALALPDAAPDQVASPAAAPDHRASPDGIAPPEPAPARRRPLSARIAPQALADAQPGGVREGLDWLGRSPESRASLLYRAIRLLARFVLFVVFRFRIDTSGRENLPSGGYLLVGAAHRGWMDPFLVLQALPTEPRAWFLGSAPSTFTSRWRELLIHRIGGLLPVWRGGIGIDTHVAAAQAVVANGGVFAQMPEGTVNGPAGRIGTFRTGWAIIALRTRAAIVPFAMAGTEELYLGRRMASRILRATTVEDLLGLDGQLPSPDKGSRGEFEVARRLTDALALRLGPVVEELHAKTIDPPNHSRRLRGRLTWLLLRRGKLDRAG